MDSSKTIVKGCNKPRSHSVVKAARQYLNKDKAKLFASSVPGTKTDRREKRCLRKALAFLGLLPGSSVLDIPCGAGRMFPLLKQNGYRVTGADISASMIEEAVQADYDNLKITDIFETAFFDNQFDLVICHRLFQYFSEAFDRRSALAELHRISKGPIVVSFSCNLALDVLAYKIKRFIGITRTRSCQPIRFGDFTKDAQAVGLEVVRWIAIRPLISRRWYAVMRPQMSFNVSPCQKLATFSNISFSLLSRAGICTTAIVLFMLVTNLIMQKTHKTILQLQQAVGGYVHDDDRLYFTANTVLTKVAFGVGTPISDERLNIRDIIQKDKILNKDSVFLLSQQHAENIKGELSKELQFVKYLEFRGDRFALFSTETEIFSTDLLSE